MFSYTKLMQAMSGAAAATADAFFNLVTLLLNTTATNGAQNNTFLDSSTNNFTITRNGNTTQGTFTPFSQTGWGTHFTGTSGTRLTYPGSASTYVSGTGDFTIEMWINIDAASAGRSRILIEGDVSNGIQFRLGPSNTSNLNGLSVSRVFQADNEYCDFTFAFSTWYHVAVCRASAVYYFFVNGVQYTTQGSGTATYDFQVPSTVSIGDNASYPNDEIYKGYISNIRVSNVARYTSNFTPSTTPLTALSGTQFLSLQNNRWIDNSTNNSTITSVGSSGTPSVQAFSPFLPTAAYDAAVVGGSGYFDGSGDNLSLANNAALFPGTGDFTLEFWIYPTVISGNQMIWGTSANGLDIYRASASGKLLVDQSNVGTILTSTANVIANTWTHYAVTRSGTTARLFVNGVLDATATNSADLTNANSPAIGSSPGGTNPYTGYIAGFRFVKGTALYTATFSIPTVPPTAVTNTQLLTNYTNAGIFDSAAKNVAETVGNAQVSTTQAKWGTTSMAFDGTGDNLLVKRNNFFDFGTGDFTFEVWIYFNSVASIQTFVSNYQNSSNGWGLQWRSDTGIWNFFNGDTALVTYTNTPSTGTWIHAAVARSGTSLKMFINGTQVGSVTNSTNISGTTTDLTVGSLGSIQYFNGYMDDMRITKGYARYTASFTPPTAAFPTL